MVDIPVYVKVMGKEDYGGMRPDEFYHLEFRHGDNISGFNVVNAEEIPHKDSDCAWCRQLRDRIQFRTMTRPT